MKNLTNIIEYQKQIISFETKVETELEIMLAESDNNYYFEINIRQGNTPDCKVIWLSFCLPVLSSQSEKKLLKLGLLWN